MWKHRADPFIHTHATIINCGPFIRFLHSVTHKIINAIFYILLVLGLRIQFPETQVDYYFYTKPIDFVTGIQNN